VVPLTTQQEVEAWCAAVTGLAQLQQAAQQLSTQQAAISSSSSSSQCDIATLLPVLGAAVGTLPAAVTMRTSQQQQQQQGQQQRGCTVVGLVAVQLQEQQPMSLLSLVNGAGTPTASASGDAHKRRLQHMCTALQCAAQAAAAVGQLCITMAHCMDPAAAAGNSLLVLAELLQGVSCTELARSLVVGSPVSHNTQLRLNPATLLMVLHKCSPDCAQQELKLLLSAVQQLQQQQGAATIQTAAAAGPGGGSLAGHGSAGWCLRQLEQRLRDVQQQQQPSAQVSSCLSPHHGHMHALPCVCGDCILVVACVACGLPCTLRHAHVLLPPPCVACTAKVAGASCSCHDTVADVACMLQLYTC
jgi:hypothetical protein